MLHLNELVSQTLASCYRSSILLLNSFGNQDRNKKGEFGFGLFAFVLDPAQCSTAIHLLQVDLVPFYSVRFTWDRRTNWARLFFSQLQSGLVASFWCPRRTFRLPRWTIWSHKGRSLGRLVNPVNTTVVNHSVVNNQIAIHEATSANMETTSDASWYRRPCFRIVVLLLELLLVPWLSSIPCILYCLHCRWSWSEGNRAICEGRLAMQFAGYFL